MDRFYASPEIFRSAVTERWSSKPIIFHHLTMSNLI